MTGETSAYRGLDSIAKRAGGRRCLLPPPPANYVYTEYILNKLLTPYNKAAEHMSLVHTLEPDGWTRSKIFGVED